MVDGAPLGTDSYVGEVCDFVGDICAGYPNGTGDTAAGK